MCVLPPAISRDPPHRSLFGRLPRSTVTPPPSQGGCITRSVRRRHCQTPSLPLALSGAVSPPLSMRPVASVNLAAWRSSSGLFRSPLDMSSLAAVSSRSSVSECVWRLYLPVFSSSPARMCGLVSAVFDPRLGSITPLLFARSLSDRSLYLLVRPISFLRFPSSLLSRRRLHFMQSSSRPGPFRLLLRPRRPTSGVSSLREV